MSPQTVRNQINRKLSKMDTYQNEIPVTAIFEILRESGVEAVQEDGTPWSGFLCGESASTAIGLKGLKGYLWIGWYKMPSGRYEITSYVA